MTIHDYARSRRRRWPVLLGLMTVLTLPQGHTAWYAKFDGVGGELVEGTFAGWTQVQSVGALVSLPIDPTNGVPGPASFSCEVLKGFDRTSPALLQRCAQREACRRVTLSYVLAQPEATQYRITLDNVFIASLAQDRSSNSLETIENEKITLTFDKIELACFELDASGGTTGGLTALFDQTTGQGLLKNRPPFRAVITRQNGRTGMLVTWPAESGHRYRILARATLGQPWTSLGELTASEDGPASQFVPTDTPALFMQIQEID